QVSRSYDAKQLGSDGDGYGRCQNGTGRCEHASTPQIALCMTIEVSPQRRVNRPALPRCRTEPLVQGTPRIRRTPPRTNAPAARQCKTDYRSGEADVDHPQLSTDR